MDDRLVDLVCVRTTHQTNDHSVVVSLRGGNVLACPSGETVGHVWLAASGLARPDDRRLAETIVGSGRVRIGLRPDN